MPDAPAISRIETMRTLRIANLDVGFATAFMTLVSGAFLVGFVDLLGGSDMWIGLLTAIPSLVGILQIPGAAWGRGFPSFKPFITVGGITWRICHLPLILLPLAPLTGDARLTILAVCLAVGSSAIVIVNPIYNDYIAEMVPVNSRGTYFSQRNAIAAAVGATAGLAGGFILDAFKHRGQQEIGFTVIFAAGVVCAGISMAIFLRMGDIPRANPVKQDLRAMAKSLKVPFADRDFRKVLWFLGMFTFGQLFGGNLFAKFALETLKLEFTWLQGAAFAFAIGNVIASKWWGFLSDRYGTKPMMALAAAGLCLNPVVWIFCQPGQMVMNIVILMIAHVFMGAIFAGVALCQFNLLLATAKTEDRPIYLGAGMALQAIVGGISPLAGSALMVALRAPMGAETAFKIVFGSIIFFRLVACFFLIPVKEEGATRLSETLHQITRIRPRGIRALRTLNQGTTIEERESAIREVASEHLGLATDTLIQTLHDPLPRMRRQAAEALAKLNDPRAVEALVHQLDEHPDLVEEETIEALGMLGGPVALDALVRALRRPESVLRRAAARALGKVGANPNDPADDQAVQALLAAAEDRSDPDLRRASLQALRIMGAPGTDDVVRAALLEDLPSLRVAAAEATAELGLPLAETLRESIRAYDDEACAEAAYALGVVGDASDIPIILGVAAKTVSMITRRRCLLGIARLLEVESQCYRLLLMTGMERDGQVLAIGQQARKKFRRMRTSLDLYATGFERDALIRLSKNDDPVLAAFAAEPVDELFLVAICYLARKANAMP